MVKIGQDRKTDCKNIDLEFKFNCMKQVVNEAQLSFCYVFYSYLFSGGTYCRQLRKKFWSTEGKLVKSTLTYSSLFQQPLSWV